jgi:hypothetical protein
MAESTKLIPTKGIKPVAKIFHNESIPVYPMTLPFSEVQFWADNARTWLAFDLLKKKENNRAVTEIELRKVTYFLAERPEFDIPRLARSIDANGVRVPLILRDNHRLLDGNRRFFACSFLHFEAEKRGQKDPGNLSIIPTDLVRGADLTDALEAKIIAEANFVRDLRIPWPVEVKARVISEYFRRVEGQRGAEVAYKEIKEIYSLNRKEVDEYVETLDICQEFIGSAKDKEKAREQVQENFVYFWEFRNKSSFKRGALSPAERKKVKILFFGMMGLGRFRNIKQIEPMIRAVRLEKVWDMIASSEGLKMEEASAIYHELKSVRSIEDKLRSFWAWLDNVPDEAISDNARDWLEMVSELAKKRSKQ